MMKSEILKGYESVKDPREFLTRPFTKVETGVLAIPPTKDLLEWLPTLPNEEVAVVKTYGTWFISRVGEMGPGPLQMPRTADILIHSHFTVEDEIEKPGYVPSLSDFLNCSETAANYISSRQGLTKFFKVQDHRAINEFQAERERFRPITRTMTNNEYQNYLNMYNAKFELLPWDDIDDLKFSELLQLDPV
jgi:hypothetical protein